MRSAGIVAALVSYHCCQSACAAKGSLRGSPKSGQVKDLLQDEQARLSPEQLETLRAIKDGRIGRAQVEVVLAHHNEDLSWSEPYAKVRTIYCKGTSRPKGCLRLKNVGREGHTYLRHIVSRYHSLADWTVFSQAGAPSSGYKGHRLGGGHMLPGVSFHDYVLRNTSLAKNGDDSGMFMVFTGALHLATMKHSLRSSYFDTARSQQPLQQRTCPKGDHGDAWEPFMEMDWFREFLGQKCAVEPSELGRSVREYWRDFVKLPEPPSSTVFFAQGARFAASRERIQQRPREHYEALLLLLEEEEDPCANYINEWLWFYMIGAPQSVPCDMTPPQLADGAPMPERLSRHLQSCQDASNCAMSGVPTTTTASTPTSSTSVTSVVQSTTASLVPATTSINPSTTTSLASTTTASAAVRGSFSLSAPGATQSQVELAARVSLAHQFRVAEADVSVTVSSSQDPGRRLSDGSSWLVEYIINVPVSQKAEVMSAVANLTASSAAQGDFSERLQATLIADGVDASALLSSFRLQEFTQETTMMMTTTTSSTTHGTNGTNASGTDAADNEDDNSKARRAIGFLVIIILVILCCCCLCIAGFCTWYCLQKKN